MTTDTMPPVSDSQDRPPPRRRARRDLIVGLIALLIALLVGSWLGYALAPKVDVSVTCTSPGAPRDVTHKHLSPGSSFTKECNTE